MGTTIEFSVSERPPKKHGEKSMWARDDEADFVINLRKAALEAKARTGVPVFTSRVRLEVSVFAPNVEGVGDLDSFITGICDGLQAADKKVWDYIHPKIMNDASIDYRMPMLIDDDKRVVSISATKEQSQTVHYKVRITEI